MSQQDPPSGTSPQRSQGDPWHAFGYVVAGVGFYGFLGWLGDQWLGTSFLVAIGILLGACLGIYLTISRFDSLPRASREQSDQQSDQT